MRAGEVAVVVGNPRARSRTFAVGTVVGAALTHGRSPADVVDLADHAGDLFRTDGGAVTGLLDRVRRADVVVVASPTYKATYTGLLKSFLDRITTELAGRVAVPVMVAGAPTHALAVEVHLRPLLVELGAQVPTPGLFVLEADVESMTTEARAWAEEHAELIWALSTAAVRNRPTSRSVTVPPDTTSAVTFVPAQGASHAES